MKDMTSVATTMMSDEEKAEVERQMNAGAPGASTVQDGASPGASTSHISSTPAPSSAIPIPRDARDPAPAAAADARPPDGLSAATPAPAVVTQTTAQGTSGGAHVVLHGSAAAGAGSPSPSASAQAEKEAREAEKRRKAEQREKLREHDRARRKAMEERVAMLTKKMVERIRPYVEAKHPGGKDDAETLVFEQRMRREVEDLKLESFGVEVRALCSLRDAIGSYALCGGSFCTRLVGCI